MLPSLRTPGQPFYFGKPDARLFGCFHPAATPDRTARAVLLCNPIGHEYLACHRALRQLAVRLARAGFAALRFDYYGSGDSAGAADAGTPALWLRDIGQAGQEVRGRQGGISVCLVGLRLGAAMALMHAVGRTGSSGGPIVLWDPVVNGRDYVSELIALHRDRFPERQAIGPARAPEVLGFPLTDALRAELEDLDLLSLRSTPVDRLLIIETGRPRDGRALERHLRQLGASVEYTFLDTPSTWQEQPDTVLVPNTVLQAVIACIKDA